MTGPSAPDHFFYTWARPFVFSGDHGDYPAPQQVMLWEQWDDKSIAVIRDTDGSHYAAIVTGRDLPTAGAAIASARAYLRERHCETNDREGIAWDLKQLRAALDQALSEIEFARIFGDHERIDRSLETLADIV